MDEATAAGLMVNISLAPDAFGRVAISSFVIAKRLIP
jgi:hypothetical protein